MNDFFDWIKDIGLLVYRFFTNRMLWLLVVMAILFYVLLTRLFELQIILADTYKTTPPSTKIVTVPLQAPRGTIYDRYGRPLAVNKLAYTVKMDPSITISNDALLTLVNALDKNGESYIDSFPMTKDEPYEFIWEGESREWLEDRWKKDMTVENPETATAQESFEFLRKQFKIDPELSNDDARKILNFRCMIYMQRYDPVPIIFAYDIKPETLSYIE